MKSVVGQKIISVRNMTKRELAFEGWDDRYGICLVLENGILLYASQDDEGNGVGALFGRDGEESFHIGVEK